MNIQKKKPVSEVWYGFRSKMHLNLPQKYIKERQGFHVFFY